MYIILKMSEKLRIRIEKYGDKTNNIVKRLRSIDIDRMFVLRELDKIQDISIFANERCGNWYCYGIYNGTCYFKSTDGHRGKWSFNDRRINIDCVIEAFKKGGLAIIDSTGNRKKKIPDSLSKTIPIWIYIFNNILCNEDISLKISLTISDEEKDEINIYLREKKEEWKKLLLTILPVEILTYLKEISWNNDNNSHRVLTPVWVYNDRPLNPIEISDIKKKGDVPIILISASDPNLKEDWYLMGSADDEEMWSAGLTTNTFYENKDLLFSCLNDSVAYKLIQKLIENKTSGHDEIHNKINLFNDSITINPNLELITSTHIAINILQTHIRLSEIQLNLDINLNSKIGIVDFLKIFDNFIKMNDNNIPIIIYTNKLEIASIIVVALILIKLEFRNKFNIEIISKSEIRRIIGYIQHHLNLNRLSRNVCKQFNKYFIKNRY